MSRSACKLDQLDELVGRKPSLIANALSVPRLRPLRWKGTVTIPGRPGMAKITIENESRPAQRSNDVGRRANGQPRHGIWTDAGSSDIHRDPLEARRTRLDRDFLAVLHQALQVSADGVLDHRPSL